MEITIGKYRISSEPTCVVLSRIATHRKTGEDYLAEATYWPNLESACKGLLTRLGYDALSLERPDVVDVKSLRETMLQAKAEIVAAVREAMENHTVAESSPEEAA